MASTLVLAGLVAGCLLLLWSQGRQHVAERTEWAKERSELLTRIQHPEIVPPAENVTVEPFEVSDDLPEMAKVGQLIYDDDGDHSGDGLGP